NVGAQFSGFLKITTAGSYTFQTASDDGSLLYVDGNLVVNNDGSHSLATVTSSAVALGAGMHSIQERYLQGSGNAGDSGNYSGPDRATRGPTPAAVLFNSATPITFNNKVTLAAGSNSTIDVGGSGTAGAAGGGAGLDVALPSLTDQGGTLNVTSSVG